MFDISSYFIPVKKEIVKNKPGWQTSQIGHIIDIHTSSSFPEIDNIEIAFFSIPEYDGTENRGNDHSAVREELYQLHFEQTPKLVDLGTMQLMSTRKESFKHIELICANLLSKGIVPLIIGGGQDISYAIYKAYASIGKIITFTSVDNSFDLGTNEDKIDSHSYLGKIIAYQPNHLFNYCNIGFQTYFVSPEAIDMLDKIHFDTFRLGSIKSNIIEVEPLMRNTDFLSFDLSAISGLYAPANVYATPNGLGGTQTCSIMRYAGLSDKVSTCGIFEYNQMFDENKQTAKLIAQMFWYFLDGFKNRNTELNPDLKECTKYTVTFDNGENEVVFYKSNKTGRWWIGIPFIEKQKKEKYFVACSYRDYEKANKGDLPELWMKTYRRLH